MRLPSFNLTFELVRSNANMDFDVFCKYIQSRMERMPKHFIVQPDGISFGISCESAANIIEACETVSVLFQKEHLVDVQYYATPNYNLLSIDPTSYYTLLVSGNEADLDDSKSKANGFSRCLCADCKMPDFYSIKLPFLINEKYRKKIQRHKYLLIQCMNGFRVLSSDLFSLLKEDIGGHVDTGPVAYFDDPSQILENAIWIRPKQMIGTPLGVETVNRCKTCQKETIVYKQVEKRALLAGMDFYSSIESKLPIALSGSWMGNITKRDYIYVVWNVLISGAILQKLIKYKVCNLVPEATPIYGIEEYHYLEKTYNETVDAFKRNMRSI